MRFSIIAVLASLSAFGLAQDLVSSLPKCAQECFGSDLGGCQSSDFKCVCGNTQLIADISCCVSRTCTPAEQESIISLAVGLCKANGIDVPTSASCAATASGSPSGSATTGSNSAAVTSGSSASGTPAPQSTGAAAPFPTAGCGVGMGVMMAGLFAAM